MATNKVGFVTLAYEKGFSDYEILICVFLKHFKFLHSYGSYGGYQLEGYSWHAHEQQIVLYSIEYRISVFFCIVGESIDVYFERRSLFSKDSWNFTDILRAKNVTNYPTKFSINSMEDIFSEYALLVKKHADLILKRKKWK